MFNSVPLVGNSEVYTTGNSVIKYLVLIWPHFFKIFKVKSGTTLLRVVAGDPLKAKSCRSNFIPLSYLGGVMDAITV